MKATIRGIPVEGTPQEIAELIHHFDGDGPQTPVVVPWVPYQPWPGTARPWWEWQPTVICNSATSSDSTATLPFKEDSTH